jgi:hypothetical protein
MPASWRMQHHRLQDHVLCAQRACHPCYIKPFWHRPLVMLICSKLRMSVNTCWYTHQLNGGMPHSRPTTNCCNHR